MLIYVSGAVTGCENENREAFEHAAKVLRLSGHAPWIPHAFVGAGTPWPAAMRECLLAMLECEGVAMLPGWELSRGAKLEHMVAEACGIPCKPLREWTREGAVTRSAS